MKRYFVAFAFYYSQPSTLALSNIVVQLPESEAFDFEKVQCLIEKEFRNRLIPLKLMPIIINWKETP